MVMCVIVAVTWSENYGNKSHSLKQSMTKAATSIRDGMCYHIIGTSKKTMVIFLLSLHEIFLWHSKTCLKRPLKISKNKGLKD